MTSPSTTRRSLFVALFLGTALAVSACGPADGAAQPDPGADGQAAGAGGSGPGEAPEEGAAEEQPEQPPAPPAPSYPDSAQAYAEAALAAWAAGEIETLAALTTAGVQEQMIEIPAPVNHEWT